MPEIAWVKSLVKVLVLPPGGPLLVAVVGLALWSRRPRLARALVACAVLTMLALSLPVVSGALARAFSAPAAFEPSRAGAARAIVILGGGTRESAPEYGGATLGRLTLERVRYGARVARLTGLPVLVAGGSAGDAAPEAALMRDSLRSEFGVDVRWIEPRSRNTHENARLSSALLKAAGINKVVLVAHAFDMPRATAEFSAAGIDAVPAPIDIPGDLSDIGATDFVPSIFALERSYYVLYEVLGCIAFALSGRAS